MEARLMSDKELIRRYISGNQSSLEVLIYRHKNRIYGYILMLVKDKELAEDIFQDTFIKVINTIRSGQYKEEGKFIQWALRIAHNLVIDHFRKAQRLPMVEQHAEYDLFEKLKISVDSVEERMVTEQIHEDVKKLIDFLPEEQREVLIMRHYNEMSFKDIAEQTNVSINTALGRMRYALINLRKLIEKKHIILTA